MGAPNFSVNHLSVLALKGWAWVRSGFQIRTCPGIPDPSSNPAFDGPESATAQLAPAQLVYQLRLSVKRAVRGYRSKLLIKLAEVKTPCSNLNSVISSNKESISYTL